MIRLNLELVVWLWVLLLWICLDLDVLVGFYCLWVGWVYLIADE